MNLGGYSETGPREANEDSLYFRDFSQSGSFPSGISAFAMVSDGMGGYQGGDIASGIAVATAESYLDGLFEMAHGGNQVDVDITAAIDEIVANSHAAICAEIKERENASMGATFVGAFISPNHAWIGHVGDSRCYLVRDGQATQLTEDHSQVGRMLARGLISEEEAQNHPARNRIEQALGFSDSSPEIDEIDLLPGDALLLCSDGVSTVLDSAALASCITKAKSAEDAARRVVDMALRKGTDDNSTAVVVFPDRAASTTNSVTTLAEHTQPLELVDGQPFRARLGGQNSANKATNAPARPSASKRLSKNTIIPIAALAVLAAIALTLMFCARDSSTSQTVEVGPAASSTPAAGASAPPASGTGASASSSMAATSSVEAGATLAEYQLAESDDEGWKLRFVDKEGVAHNFNEYSGIDIPSISDNTRITAYSELVDHQVNGSVRSYYDLDGIYLTALKSDVERYKQASETGAESTALSYNNELTRIMASSEYGQFIESLATSTEISVDQIDTLALPEEALKKASTAVTTSVGPKVSNSEATISADVTTADDEAANSDNLLDGNDDSGWDNEISASVSTESTDAAIDESVYGTAEEQSDSNTLYSQSNSGATTTDADYSEDETTM